MILNFAVAPAIEEGNVWMANPGFVPEADWAEDFLLEFSRFPHSKHVAQVEAAPEALARLGQNQQMGDFT